MSRTRPWKSQTHIPTCLRAQLCCSYNLAVSKSVYLVFRLADEAQHSPLLRDHTADSDACQGPRNTALDAGHMAPIFFPGAPGPGSQFYFLFSALTGVKMDSRLLNRTQATNNLKQLAKTFCLLLEILLVA